MRPINHPAPLHPAALVYWTARCHHAVGGGTACGWCVGDQNDTMAGTAARERGSCHLYGSLPTPSYSMLDLACCAALVNASVARVSRAHGQSQASARCSLLASFHAAPTLPTPWTACKIVHARVRWLGRKGVIEDIMFVLDESSVYSWSANPPIPLLACLLQHCRPPS